MYYLFGLYFCMFLFLNTDTRSAIGMCCATLYSIIIAKPWIEPV